MRSHAKTCRRLQFESLQSRELMAGDVTVNVQNNAVDIVGDNYDNAIQLGYDSLGRLTVTGLNNTTVNGGASHIVMGPWRDIGVVLAGGADRLTTTPTQALVVPGSMLVYMGAGDDTIEMQSVEIQDAAGYFHLEGAKQTLLSDVQAAGRVDLTAWDLQVNGLEADGRAVLEGQQNLYLSDISVGGRADIWADQAYIANGDVAGDVKLYDASNVYMYDFHAGGDFKVLTEAPVTIFEGHQLVVEGSALLDLRASQAGNMDQDYVTITHSEFFRDLDILTGQGVDSVSLQNVTVHPGYSLHVDTDSHRDHVLLDSVEADMVYIDTADGNDHVSLLDGSMKNVDISTGSGNDSLTADRVAVDNFYANLGGGSDMLGLFDSVINNLEAFGGSGEDTLWSAGNRIRSAEVHEFEAPSKRG